MRVRGESRSKMMWRGEERRGGSVVVRKERNALGNVATAHTRMSRVFLVAATTTTDDKKGEGSDDGVSSIRVDYLRPVMMIA